MDEVVDVTRAFSMASSTSTSPATCTRPQTLDIFITKDFVIKIGDFGLGKKFDEQTRQTAFVGTPLYCAP